jgi:hypothetical protein
VARDVSEGTVHMLAVTYGPLPVLTTEGCKIMAFATGGCQNKSAGPAAPASRLVIEWAAGL